MAKGTVKDIANGRTYVDLLNNICGRICHLGVRLKLEKQEV